MKYWITIFGMFLIVSACKTTKKAIVKKEAKKEQMNQGTGKSGFVEGVPEITFDESHHNFGDVPQGQLREKIFSFTNTGNAPLEIELVTACTCTELEWPQKAIMPGERGAVLVVFNSAGKEGETTVDVDIIANTDPIVVEASFRANVVIPE